MAFLSLAPSVKYNYQIPDDDVKGYIMYFFEKWNKN
jgi:hypothetical protein